MLKKVERKRTLHGQQKHRSESRFQDGNRADRQKKNRGGIRDHGKKRHGRKTHDITPKSMAPSTAERKKENIVTQMPTMRKSITSATQRL